MKQDLKRQVAWLTATENIRSVIARYARAGDDQNNPEQMRQLLAEDAVWEAKGFGKFSGRDLIAEELSKIGQEMIIWSLHFPVSPIIDIADDLNSAHAFWWLWELTTMRGMQARRKATGWPPPTNAISSAPQMDGRSNT